MLWMGIRACPLSALTNNWSVKRRHEFGACVPPNHTKAKEFATRASKCAVRRVRQARPSNGIGRPSLQLFTRSDLNATEVPQSVNPAPTPPCPGSREGQGHQREASTEHLSVVRPY